MFMLLLLHRIDSAAWLYYALYRSTEREEELIDQTERGSDTFIPFFSEKLYADSRFVAAALFECWSRCQSHIIYI